MYFRIKFTSTAIAVILTAVSAHCFSQDLVHERKIHLIWMGGSDCPPCENWRRFELSKLKESPEFKKIKFSYVIKTIKSPVPPTFFLPDDVKPYKNYLDDASSGRAGSPQAAVLVDGKVYDYFQGTRSAEELEKMFLAIRTDTAYPFKRCIRASKQWNQCDIAG